MKKTCRELRDLLALRGADLITGDARTHLEDCDDCLDFLEHLATVEKGLAELAPVDVADEVVSDLLARPELSAKPDTKPSRTLPMFSLLRNGWVLGSAAVLIVAVLAWGVVVPSLLRARVSGPEVSFVEREGELSPTEAQKNELGGESNVETSRLNAGLESLPQPIESMEEEPRDEVGGMGDFVASSDAPARGQLAPTPAMEPIPPPPPPSLNFLPDEPTAAPKQGASATGRAGAYRESPETIDELAGGDRVEQGLLDSRGDNQVVPGKLDAASSPSNFPKDEAKQDRDGLRAAGEKRQNSSQPERRVYVEPVYPDIARQAGIVGVVLLQLTVDPEGNVIALRVLRSVPVLDEAAMTAARQWKYVAVDKSLGPRRFVVSVPFESSSPEHESESSLVEQFLKERSSVEGVRFVEAKGYWANTYLPGAPWFRQLHLRFRDSGVESFGGYVAREPQLHRASRPIVQPLDAPRKAAVSVTLRADRRGLTGPGRLLLQVGVQATSRHSRRRPPMNVSLVINCDNGLSQDEAARLRSLLLAFNQAKELGDRFRLVATEGGLLLTPEAFRHGPLTIALDQLSSPKTSPTTPLTLTQAVVMGLELTHRDDDPEMPLGSSQVILVTRRAQGEDVDRLARLAHRSAVGGVPLSIVSIGSHAVGSERQSLTQLALAGQGRLHWLERSSEAATVVERELTAASRVVARALRLRIKLAEGVQLIDVLGSRPLDEQQAQRVREAEASIDLRLSRNLGIEADRGEDEDGVQIVIPSFYAGEAHTILLDVIAPGPGPIAEVTARYKDLAELRNTVAQASLRLERGEASAGPLERNVLKNFLVHRLSLGLDAAGDALDSGRLDAARQSIAELEELLGGISRQVPGLSGDRELASDIAMLGEYRAILESAAMGRPELRAYLADSLRYASGLKRFPIPTLS